MNIHLEARTETLSARATAVAETFRQAKVINREVLVPVAHHLADRVMNRVRSELGKTSRGAAFGMLSGIGFSRGLKTPERTKAVFSTEKLNAGPDDLGITTPAKAQREYRLGIGYVPPSPLAYKAEIVQRPLDSTVFFRYDGHGLYASETEPAKISQLTAGKFRGHYLFEYHAPLARSAVSRMLIPSWQVDAVLAQPSKFTEMVQRVGVNR